MKKERLDLFASIFDAMQAAVSLSNKNLPQAIKEAATTKVVECLDKMTDFERQEIFQQKSNWIYCLMRCLVICCSTRIVEMLC